MIQLETNYITADKSIETYIHNNSYMALFNNQGLYFDVFFSKEKLHAFLDATIERGDLFFTDEHELNTYFQCN